MSIESGVYGSQVAADTSQSRCALFPRGLGARILEHSPVRLVLLFPAGPSRASRSAVFFLLGMNGSFIGGMAWWTSAVMGRAQNGFIIAVVAAFAIFLAGYSSIIIAIWLRLRFQETWILVERSRIAVKNTLFRRSKLRTYDVQPDTVATFVSSQMAGESLSQTPGKKSTPGFNIRIRCGRKTIVFGTVLSLNEKQWILDEINRILSGDDPLLSSVVLREGKFEFVPDEVAPEQACGNVRIDPSATGVLAFEATAKPRTPLRIAGALLTFVLSGLAGLLLIANLFMRWWFAGMPYLGLCAFTFFPLVFVGLFFWTSAAMLFVTTRITLDRERLTRSRTGTFFGGLKSIPTSSTTEVVVRMRDDPRGRRDGNAYLRWPDRRGADCLVRTASDSLELSLVQETADVLQIAGLVRYQLKRFERASRE